VDDVIDLACGLRAALLLDCKTQIVSLSTLSIHVPRLRGALW